MFRFNVLKYANNACVGEIISRHVLNNNFINLAKYASTKFAQNKLEENITSHSKNHDTQEVGKEKQFLAQLKNDPDIFGERVIEEKPDEGDVAEEKYFTEQVDPRQKLRTKQYADIIKSFIAKRQIKEAIDVVEIRMIKEDRVKPEAYIYNLLLGGCGRVGYTKKAFMLYNVMKKRGLNITGGTYTALFNACANSPWPLTDGLTRAKHLREIMIEKQIDPNETNYNAMIKAFGRCGDLPTAFSLVDEMMLKGISIKDDTINFLIQACITDKEAGFRHALLVWRKLIDKKITPTIFTFNLLLRCVRDCGLGDLSVTEDVINKLLGENNLRLENNKINLIEGSTMNNQNQSEENDVSNELLNDNLDNSASVSTPVKEVKEIVNYRPNLLAETPYLGNIVSLSDVTEPEHRLLLIGGCSGFLETMAKYKCNPDVKTFTQLLHSIPSTLAAEKDLILAMKKLKVKPDIDFFNILMKKRSLRRDYENAKQVLNMIKDIRYNPDIVTYGVLAMACQNKEEAIELLAAMKSKNIRMNIEIIGAMLGQACHYGNFGYVLYIMELCIKEEIQPSKKFMENLDKFYKRFKELSNTTSFSPAKQKAYTIFKLRYKTWKEEVKVDESEESHPWQQYRQPSTASKYFKVKDATRFKQKHISLFKVKTSPKHLSNKSG